MNKIDRFQCPRCAGPMNPGFANESTLISHLSAEQVLRFVHKEGDVHDVPLWKRFLPHPAHYLLTHLCPKCGIYTIDFKNALSSEEAKALAKSILDGSREWPVDGAAGRPP